MGKYYYFVSFSSSEIVTNALFLSLLSIVPSLGKRGGERELGGVERGQSVVGMYCAIEE